MAKITIRIEAKNIGPHLNLNTELENESCKIGLYANNGSGKTFLSRAFRIYTKSINNEISNNDLTKMLSFGADSAYFKFDVENKDTGEVKSLNYAINKGDPALTISRQSKYIFHVFNKDYVDQNLETCGYSPSGEIEGYILGKDKIDLSREEDELSKKKEKSKKIKDFIAESINSSLSELKALGVKAVTNEFKQINFETITGEAFVYEGEAFEVLKEKHEKLKSMPADLPEAANFDLPTLNDLLNTASDFFEAKISKSSIAEEFKQKVKSKQAFIESGVALVSNSQCPFCEQEINKSASDLINMYIQYLEDSESKEANKARNLIDQLNLLAKNFEKSYYSYNEGLNKFNQIKEYLPSAEFIELSVVENPNKINNNIGNLKSLLQRKAADISLVFSQKDYKTEIDQIADYYQTLKQVNLDNGTAIEKLNNKKNKVQQEKTGLNKQLCLAKIVSLREVMTKHIDDFRKINAEVELLETDIRTKRNKHKKEKKSEVMKTFEECLKIFFGNKYSFDKKKFCLTFKDNILKRNATDVLSDGEKSIVAFCFYLADTHRIIKDDDDYEKLFFIIDDPISSMDFHYVYSVSQCIKSLNKYFPLMGNRQRFLILTHNLEFISILGRNKICTNNYHLSNGSFIKTKGNSALPYEEHLRDVLKVSQDEILPSHTTPNSIRHILETINKFKSPNKEFNEFFLEVDELKDDPFLYSLIHDHSHGALRSQPAYMPEQIKRSCSLVIKYIEKYFEGQIKSII